MSMCRTKIVFAGKHNHRIKCDMIVSIQRNQYLNLKEINRTSFFVLFSNFTVNMVYSYTEFSNGVHFYFQTEYRTFITLHSNESQKIFYLVTNTHTVFLNAIQKLNRLLVSPSNSCNKTMWTFSYTPFS